MESVVLTLSIGQVVTLFALTLVGAMTTIMVGAMALQALAEILMKKINNILAQKEYEEECERKEAERIAQEKEHIAEEDFRYHYESTKYLNINKES